MAPLPLMVKFHIRHSHMDTNTSQSGQDEALSNASYDQWVSQYKMRDKVACPTELRRELDDQTVECRFEVGDGPVTDTGIHRRPIIYLMLMWALCK
jgi:hypothetical protein